jgi:hypothetical protein
LDTTPTRTVSGKKRFQIKFAAADAICTLVSRLAEQAQDLLDAATAAAARGECCTDMAILIGNDGSIRMCAESDWPLDSLAREHGARAAYRVTGRDGAVRVEGREGMRRCLLESRSPNAIARLLLR